MTIWYFLKLSFLILYTSICAYLAHIMYKYEKDYYEPIYVMKKMENQKMMKKENIFTMYWTNSQDLINQFHILNYSLERSLYFASNYFLHFFGR